jgi:hypothetical protein
MSDKHPPKHAAGEPGPDAQAASPVEDRTAAVVSVDTAGGAMEPSAVPATAQSGQLPGGPDTCSAGSSPAAAWSRSWRCCWPSLSAAS